VLQVLAHWLPLVPRNTSGRATVRWTRAKSGIMRMNLQMIMTVPLCASTPAHRGRTPRNDISINFRGARRSGHVCRSAATRRCLYSPEGRKQRNAHLVRISGQSGNASQIWVVGKLFVGKLSAAGSVSWTPAA
jgi:hypothetical protein